MVNSVACVARSIKSDKSCSLKDRNTYTAARESKALLTSNEGFSVVAPMKVSSPDSTCGKNASCCDLLNRCTSSTNRMVCRPCLRRICACSTTSRISFTPDNTAESATKCASNECATSRASVVLPTPGGPQNIMECIRRWANATASGCPSPSKCFCPITSDKFCGRRRSASGVLASIVAACAEEMVGSLANKSVIVMHSLRMSKMVKSRLQS